MKSMWMILGAVLVVVAFAGVAAFSSPSESAITGNVVAQPTGDVQEVALRFENYAYVLEPSSLTVGVPVRMVVDLDTVYGCMRDVRIAAFGVSKYVKEGDNVIEFTPTKAGEFTIACSMNMGRGTFIVKKADGSTSSFKETVSDDLSAASCTSAGGCGCGGASA